MDGLAKPTTRPRRRPRGATRSTTPHSGLEVPRLRGTGNPDLTNGDDSSGLAQLARIVGSIVAQSALLTALLYYFGWSFSYWFFAYFGVDSSVLGLTTQDYLIRSVDGLFVPLTVIASIGLLALWTHIALKNRLAPESREATLRILVPITAIGGLALLAVGLWGVFAHTVFEFHFAISPLSLASGVLLLSYASRLYRTRQPANTNPLEPSWIGITEWSGVFVLVGISLFWAVQQHSAEVGISRAKSLAARLDSQPDTIVYSARSLSLHAPGVNAAPCGDSDAAYRFRYEGLKLILQSGDQYFFLPRGWTPSDGPAIVIPRSDALRLEFVLPSPVRSRTQAAC